jgi:hypothetical protein
MIANPGMGWQTFNRFADDDPNLEGIPSASAYFRFYWRDLETREGRPNYALFDSLLTRARKANQKLAFRVMCLGSNNQSIHVPQWLKDKGCPGYEFQLDGKGITRWVPDMDSPLFQEAHFRFLEALGKRYDGHPDLDLVDIGTVGMWGEWHMSSSGVKMPSEETRKKVIDTYLRAFSKTPKVMLIGDEGGMKLAVSTHSGWRADCLGDYGGFSKTWNHMENMYPVQIAKTGTAEAWKTGPVAFESCWTMQKWKDENWCISCIFDYGLEYHASYLNNKSAKIPEGSRPDIEKFLKRLGYRLVLQKLEHDRTVKAGAPLELTMVWENAGVAPPYRDYMPAIRLTGEKDGESTVIPTDISVRGWLPGSRELSASPRLPRNLRKGVYTLALAVFEPARKEPVIRLAIEGRGDDGWYPLSKIEVK